MLLELLSKKAREYLFNVPVSQLLDESFIQSSEHLTAGDKKKLSIIKETYTNYTIENMRKDQITSTTKAKQYFTRLIGNEQKEILVALFLDTKNQVIEYKEIFVGTVNSSIAHPREIFKEAVKYPTAKIMLSHNHPSGDCEPSSEDDNFTKRMKECGEMMGIELLDHIIVGQENHYSYREETVILD